MLQAMLSSVASVKAQQTKINVIGNNLANVNTTAYKSNRVNFADMMSQTSRGATRPTGNRGGTNAMQMGLGVMVAGTDTNIEQGALNQTNRITDLAIQGNGYFITSNSQRMAFSRDGGFELDSTGTLVQRASGERVVGWTADVNGNLDPTKPVGPADNIKIAVGQLNTVQVTTDTRWAGNLNSTASPTDEVMTQMRIYDPIGGAHDVTLRVFNRTVPPNGTAPAGATSSWDWEVYEGNPTTGTLLGSSATAGNARLYFDGNGKQISGLPAGQLNKINVAPGTGQSFSAFPVNLNFDNISQLTGTSQLNGIEQNGFPQGGLQSFSISQDGVITGIFTNGLTRPIAQIAMANFSNPLGLERNGSNQFLSTDNSGYPIIGAPRSGSRGVVSTGFLEQSNVDISNEFTDLIVTQRGFQANTKIVTTVDEMLQDLINMKR
jgi:flagellar hook protein FlgE